MTTDDNDCKWKYGFKRWIVLGLLITAGVLAFGLSGRYPPFKPVIPAVSLPGEELWPGAEIVPAFSIGSFHFGGIPFTNTILSTLLTDLLLLMRWPPSWCAHSFAENLRYRENSTPAWKCSSIIFTTW